ncbi:F-type H+-transporting ATPase subunit delta [Mycetocola sp. BIGb0189]|uniref:F0F1 ATP synthase subunit delta n=1 Tax=Mycetocola sp. BIGb0189 TaxID=2940604 RepID=UPI00216A6BB2|nr:F0F1 ATP synthase subunit delta [Mycetocola sp. BIGb0189]MCS4274905.1 F-type H+-transporting ATPase subunit delta [Mycetocola sp. BIGb0189]
MGSATREALAAGTQALQATSVVDQNTATELFAVGRAIDSSAQLRALLADPAAEAAVKVAATERIFAKAVSATTLGLVNSVVSQRWSTSVDLLEGIEDLGLRAAAVSAGAEAPITSELFEFGQVVASDAELELALGSKLGTAKDKAAVVTKLLEGKALPQTVAIVEHLVAQPRGRRIRELLRTAAATVADQQGFAIATVTSAVPLSDAQVERLSASLSAQYGRSLRVNKIIDPTIIGGLRVQIGDDVFDGSVSTRLSELRLQLAG